MRSVNLYRPVTCEDLASAIGVKSFELLAFLIPREEFLAPQEVIGDESAQAFASIHNVDLIFHSDDDPPTGFSAPNVPDGSPPSLDGLSELEFYQDAEDDIA